MTSDREIARRRAQASATKGGVDLAALKDEDKIRVEAEKRLGYRCAGCDERIGVGLKFVRLDVSPPPAGETRPQVEHAIIFACNGANGCDYAEKARGGADMVEMIEYVWLQGDAPVGAGQLDADVAAAEGAVRDVDPSPE